MSKVPLNQYGDPVTKSMEIENIGGRDEKTCKVQHTRWFKEAKPWAEVVCKAGITTGEAHCVYDISRRLGPGLYANLGVAGGRSLGSLAWGLKYNKHKGKVYGIDLFNWEARNGYYKIPQTKQRLASVDEYIEYCQGSTHEWAERLKHLTFNAVFIDADHHYETAKLDFELWSPLVKQGGEVAFHDTDMNTIAKVVSEIDLSKWVQTDHIYRTKVFKKL